MSMPSTQHSSETIRVGAVQYPQTALSHPNEFWDIVTRYVQAAHAESVDILLFPELFTLQVLSLETPMADGDESMRILTQWTLELDTQFQALAKEHNITLILGSHPHIQADTTRRNTARVYTPDRRIQAQDKLHVTPDEYAAWGITGGQSLTTCQTPIGEIGICICYDVEFPELARELAQRGVSLLFVPFCTDTAAGYYRVRHTAHARAIENQCYVIMAGNVGEQRTIFNFDTQYSQSAILSPCDSRFPSHGILAEAPLNQSALIISDLDMRLLTTVRQQGDVRNLSDRRPDLYSLSAWHLKNEH